MFKLRDITSSFIGAYLIYRGTYVLSYSLVNHMPSFYIRASIFPPASACLFMH